MPKNIIIVSDYPPDFLPPDELHRYMSLEEFISEDYQKLKFDIKKTKIINLCSSYKYLTSGYYCSLSAEARDIKCKPSTRDTITATTKRLQTQILSELNELCIKLFRHTEKLTNCMVTDCYFGRTDIPLFEALGRAVFDKFRLPALRITLENNRITSLVQIKSIDPIPLKSLIKDKDRFALALKQHIGSAWTDYKYGVPSYWMGILHDPKEILPPSNKKALQKFITLGKKHNISSELMTKANAADLIEYDALFIRETTAVNNHTYRMAVKAEAESIPVLDDPHSILKCCNKVYLQEALKHAHIPVPLGRCLTKKAALDYVLEAEFPMVLKVPDGSFSRDMFKVHTMADFKSSAELLFKKSDIILAQAFISTIFDWRIGILGEEVLFACRYFMAEGHWQIINHLADVKDKYGEFDCIPLADVPKDILKIALKAASLIGGGLYGVDLKQTKDAIYVIEVNDNPNLDAGIEDALEGDKIYHKILDYFSLRIRGGNVPQKLQNIQYG